MSISWASPTPCPKRATCIRHQIGAVIVANGRVVATGYNGPPKNFPHCSDLGCLRNERNIPSGEQQQVCRAVHAEQNAIIQAASHGATLDGATIYCGFYPCIICTKMIVNAGITRVVFRKRYPNELGDEIFKMAGVELVQLEGGT
jgi:dCMP deaminase